MSFKLVVISVLLANCSWRAPPPTSPTSPVWMPPYRHPHPVVLGQVGMASLEGVYHPQLRTRRPPGVVLMRLGIAKVDQQPIARREPHAPARRLHALVQLRMDTDSRLWQPVVRFRFDVWDFG
jgi:hypothetical protein